MITHQRARDSCFAGSIVLSILTGSSCGVAGRACRSCLMAYSFIHARHPRRPSVIVANWGPVCEIDCPSVHMIVPVRLVCVLL